MLIVNKHYCDEFPVSQIDRNAKQVKTVTWKILFAITMGKTLYFKHREYLHGNDVAL